MIMKIKKKITSSFSSAKENISLCTITEDNTTEIQKLVKMKSAKTNLIEKESTPCEW